MTGYSKGNDLALAGTRIVVWAMMLLLWFAILALALLLAAAGVDGEILTEIAGRTSATSHASAFAMFAVAVGGGILLLLLGTDFLRRLLAIVATVRHGDPFVAANAKRLRDMAWTLFVIQIGALVLETYAHWVERRALLEFSIDGGNPLTGLLVVLVLFVLARVFAHGAAMRDELEGTV